MKIIMMGMQGSGKGTQGALLAEALGCNFISLGDVLREDAAVRAKIATGELLSDAEVDGIVLERLQGESWVFDGYPRRRSQAETLVRAGALPDAVVMIEVPEEEAVERMLLRGREDDTEAGIRRRLEQYLSEQAGVEEVLRGAGVQIVRVDGVGAVEGVFSRVRAGLDI